MNKYLITLSRHEQNMLAFWLEGEGTGEFDLNNGEMVFARDGNQKVTVWAYQQPSE